MNPKFVVITTPNSDFNFYFNNDKPKFKNNFRHKDHKFEMTRD